MTPDHFNQSSAAIEVCDRDGLLLYLNERAVSTVASRDQLDTNILDSHPEPARLKFGEMLASGEANTYTI